jgi:4-carboxymuconolactone decarboxylase
MSDLQQPPKRYQDFVERFPELGQAWELIAEAGKKGPIDERTARLLKLAVAIGALREGAVSASVRKARAMGITREEMEQVVAIATSTLGLPSAVAAHSWIAATYERTPE